LESTCENALNAYAQDQALPRHLAVRMRKHFRYYWSHAVASSEADLDLIDQLSGLRDELLKFVCTRRRSRRAHLEQKGRRTPPRVRGGTPPLRSAREFEENVGAIPEARAASRRP
jgi:hypothetical protein